MGRSVALLQRGFAFCSLMIRVSGPNLMRNLAGRVGVMIDRIESS